MLRQAISVCGQVVAIEVPAGDVRSGTDSSGQRWVTPMIGVHYGRLIAAPQPGADGDPVDAYVSDAYAENASTDPRVQDVAYVIDQLDADTQDFDEHKIMLGFESEDAAVGAYLDHCGDHRRFGDVTPMKREELRDWLRRGNMLNPATRTVMAASFTTRSAGPWSAAGGDCGVGPGGFQPGNDCGKKDGGGGGSKSKEKPKKEEKPKQEKKSPTDAKSQSHGRKPSPSMKKRSPASPPPKRAVDTPSSEKLRAEVKDAVSAAKGLLRRAAAAVGTAAKQAAKRAATAAVAKVVDVATNNPIVRTAVTTHGHAKNAIDGARRVGAALKQAGISASERPILRATLKGLHRAGRISTLVAKTIWESGRD